MNRPPPAGGSAANGLPESSPNDSSSLTESSSPTESSPNDSAAGAADGFPESWALLLQGGQGVAMHPGALRRLVARTTALLLQHTEADPSDGFDAGPAEQAGALLVDAHFTDPDLLARAVGLLHGSDLAQGRTAELTGAFAAGWAAALRERTLAEQEAIRLAADTARRDAERALRESEARFRALFESAAIGIGIGDVEGNILAANKALQDIFGARPEDLRGRRVNDLVHPEDTPGVWEAYEELVSGKREHFQFDKPYYRQDGEVVWTHLTCSLIRDDEGLPVYQVAMLEDITDRYRLQERLRHQATHDPLTGLPNRTAFFERLEALFESPEPGARFGLCYVDLDGFKVVNDSLGHEMGDQLLAAVAVRLESALRPLGHLVARLGGDEFVVLLENCRGEQEAVAAAKTVLAALAKPVPIDGHRLAVGASVGVLERPVAATTPMAAVRAADLTLYRAKEEGRGRWTLFDPQRNARAVSRYAVSVRMPIALDRGEFFIDYQPLCTLADGSLAAVEALVRWRHPQLGVLGPDEFIGTAEETGLIMPLGRWVLEQACGQAADWVARFGDRAPQINVNLAVRQVRNAGLVSDIDRILRSSGLDPRLLQLEITESAVVGPQDESVRALHSLVDLGVSLAVDDFGTGWSNLAYLRDLPVSSLKIAGSFVSDLKDSGKEQLLGWRIIGGLVSLAHTLGLTVTAEGVENAGHAERLREMGCDWAQGWHFGRPARPEEIARRIAESTTAHPAKRDIR
ncbi:diguanylate cyclase (GGDEF)-like protein/PAS domain S-box-containing protein [Kitasatospora sp. MAP12-15]|uniref:putative bifunctional diguanylate cyclase/phosphodiesterase n=1 Tax=unclassified Kitasatospora TaxID=2633591 RepID=UPI002474D0AB|nr:EAL domain-containing protein [Kitasatospora sp. MAP12-44]MDH6109693.1 diguanylate cyclase (GGDEF)-like protein/PAS domain S-box-containing protein [Kitasatospora sp. MAP12-44]